MNQSTTIRQTLANRADASQRFLWSGTRAVCLDTLPHLTCFHGRQAELYDRSVLIATRDQLASALALIELDGVARRMVICPADVSAEHLPAIVRNGSVDAIVFDRHSDDAAKLDVALRVYCGIDLAPSFEAPIPVTPHATEWVLLTSGTTGTPKLVAHALATLTAPVKKDGLDQAADVVWGTFYDIRRYGGLQILLRTLLGRASFVLSGPDETQSEYLVRLGVRGATHISGTPSHWRRALMSPSAGTVTPRYIRLSGEIADQGVLNSLRAFYPHATVGHAFASTEAGVGFEVDDGLEGFPESRIGRNGDVEIKVEDGSLRIRSPRIARAYLGDLESPLVDHAGFVDTGDIVERRGDRYYFLGRRTGTINVGGLKVHPEEVESVINRHPAVRMSVVRPKRNPITGSLVAADIVLNRDPQRSSRDAEIKEEILKICRDRLAAHKVPATIRFVSGLDVAGAGKLARRA